MKIRILANYMPSFVVYSSLLLSSMFALKGNARNSLIGSDDNDITKYKEKARFFTQFLAMIL